jgi:hypothetical protein
MPWIVTTRYSAVVRAFIDEFPEALVELDGQTRVSAPTVWCTNSKLKSARNFSLTQGDTVLLSFHDGPRFLYAADETLPFVQALREEKLLRIGRPKRFPHPNFTIGILLAVIFFGLLLLLFFGLLLVLAPGMR